MFYEGGGVSGAKLIEKAKNKKLRFSSLKTQVRSPTESVGMRFCTIKYYTKIYKNTKSKSSQP
jgi:hypothetical protein